MQHVHTFSKTEWPLFPIRMKALHSVVDLERLSTLHCPLECH